MKSLGGIGWIILPCENIETLDAWYREKLGFTPLDKKGVVQYDLGGVLVELSGFSKRDTSAPRRFFYRDAAIILRARKVEQTIEDLKAKGVPFISDLIQIPGGKVAFFHDPEGHVWGVQERVDDPWAQGED